MTRRLRFFLSEVRKAGLPVKPAAEKSQWDFDELEVGGQQGSIDGAVEMTLICRPSWRS